MITTVTLNPTIDKRYAMPELLPGTVIRISDCQMAAGGKGINVSRVLRLDDAETVATGFVAGHSGDFLLKQLRAQGIRCEFVTTQGETRTTVNIFEQNTRRVTELLEPGNVVSEQKRQEFLDGYLKLVENSDVVCVSGSLPPAVPETFYATLVEQAKKQGKKVLLDSSGEPMRQGIKALPDLIKPNQKELQVIMGCSCTTEQEILQNANKLHQTGIPIVVVSLGADGAVMVCREGHFRGRTPVTDVQNTVGCGDSMVAGFALGLSKNQPPQEMFRHALAYASANTTRPDISMLRRQDYLEMLPQITVTKL